MTAHMLRAVRTLQEEWQLREATAPARTFGTLTSHQEQQSGEGDFGDFTEGARALFLEKNEICTGQQEERQCGKSTGHV